MKNAFSFSLVLLFLLHSTRADFWDDFANNLATDLAPFLALFGEQLTKQYLSESLFPIDYFIFAMAPIGILTALVSAVRVCGSPSLRAFVGRAQEGESAAEAELCSSTSRDVCELYNNGGIARVLGSPNILEAIHVPDSTPGKIHSSDPTAGLYTFEEYLRKFPQGSWQEPGASTDMEKKQNESYKSFALKPNLSLNVGIKNRSTVWTSVAAYIGVLLQAFVCVFAALVTFYFRWPKDGKLAPSYAFPMTLFGTLAVCSGVYLCAYLIGSRTRERHFIRKTPKDQSSNGHLIWIQPGGQIIGDQTFDAFAFSDHDNPCKDYTTSWKRSVSASQSPGKCAQDELLLWSAIGTTIVGFVAQFVGLRGMHSTVSLMQLGAIVVMSGIRALLHTQRLEKDDNAFTSCLDLVRGNELDWVALSLAQCVAGSEPRAYSGAPLNRHQFSRSRKSVLHEDHQHMLLFFGTKPCCSLIFRAKNLQSFAQDPRQEDFHLGQRQHDGMSCPISSAGNRDAHEWQNPVDICHRSLRYRARLASLTSTQNSTEQSSAPSRSWKDDFVEGRKTARALAHAIEAAAQAVTFGESKLRLDQEHLGESFTWSFICAFGPDKGQVGMSSITQDPSLGNPPHHTLHLTLRRRRSGPDCRALKEWRVNEYAVEAILTLWLWSLKWDPAMRIAPTETQSSRSRAFAMKSMRIIFATRDPRDIDTTQLELGMWLGNELITVCDHIGHYSEGPYCFAKDFAGVHTTWRFGYRSRFFGWHATDVFSERPEHIEEQQTFLLVEATSPLDVLCAQEIFAAFLAAGFGIVEDLGGQTTCQTEGSSLKFSNTQVTRLVDAFVDSGLGSREEALSCIIPVLRCKLKLPSMRCGYIGAKRLAGEYSKKGAWRVSEALLVWVLDAIVREEKESDIQDAAIALAELYRTLVCFNGTSPSMDQSTDPIALAGIEKMLQKYRHERTGFIVNIAKRYDIVCRQMMVDKGGKLDHMSLEVSNLAKRQYLHKAIQEQDLTAALYLLKDPLPRVTKEDTMLQSAALLSSMDPGWLPIFNALSDNYLQSDNN